ncbi:MAG: hypothetical protein KDA80_06280 [Planctomycetaceae bacterium]|nr:hypothetical protein [Planctomycetaceae bacterium]
MSREAQREAIRRQSAFAQELVNRIQALSSEPYFNPRELERATLSRDVALAELHSIEPTWIVCFREAPASETEFVSTSVPTQAQLQHARTSAIETLTHRHDRIQGEIGRATGTVHLRTGRFHAIEKLALQHEEFREERKREELLLQINKWELHALRDQSHECEIQIEYLRSLTVTDPPNSELPWITQWDRLAAIFQHLEQSQGAESLAQARQAYWEWKAAALRDLYDSGHAHWLETEAAQVNLYIAEKQIEAVRESRRAAQQVVSVLNVLSEHHRSPGIARASDAAP